VSYNVHVYICVQVDTQFLLCRGVCILNMRKAISFCGGGWLCENYERQRKGE
jgi:hypothetical protein